MMLGSDAGRADEVTQDVFLTLWRDLRRTTVIDLAGAWAM
jgi:hypothetical protein